MLIESPPAEAPSIDGRPSRGSSHSSRRIGALSLSTDPSALALSSPPTRRLLVKSRRSEVAPEAIDASSPSAGGGGEFGGALTSTASFRAEDSSTRLHQLSASLNEDSFGSQQRLSPRRPRKQVSSQKDISGSYSLFWGLMKQCRRRRSLASRPQALSPSAIANLAWAYAVTGHRDARLFAALSKVDEGGSRNSVNSSFSHLGLSSILPSHTSACPPPFSHLSLPCSLPPPPRQQATIPLKAYFDAAGLVTLAWAFAAFDLHDEDLFVAIGKKVNEPCGLYSSDS